MGKKKKEAKEKPLEKMTAKELRELAKEIPEITGVHGMNKEELVSAVKQAKGIADDSGKGKGSSTRELKKKMKTIRMDYKAALDADDKKKATICKRRYIRMKKKTRRAA